MSASPTPSSPPALDLAWGGILRHALLPAGDLVFKQHLTGGLSFLEKAQWWSPQQIAEERDRRLARLIQVAYDEVPYYREQMDLASVKPADVRTLADLARIPVATKDLLRDAYPDKTTRDTGQPTSESRTSGSTGKNFCTRLDAETIGSYRACFLLAIQWAGWRFGEPHMQTGMTMTRSADRGLKDRLMRCQYISAADLADETLDRHLDTIEARNIAHLWGYPGSVYCIARRALQRGWNRPLRSIVTWGDTLYPWYRETLEKAFGTRVTDTYGCAEGIQVAAQCGAGADYHVHSLNTIVEIVDDEGQAVAPGEKGSILLTRLHPGPMPLIRYRVGDVGIAGSPEPCPCGRGFTRMGGIQGRDTDIIVTPSGNRLIVHFFTGILEHLTEIESFQVIQDTTEAILLRLVPRRDITAEARETIVRKLKEKGADLRIDLEIVPEIPVAATGKRRFVISNVGKQAPAG